jgi:predicted AlkP superfamily pyrophosphatase or phosphodiesterase
MTATRKLLVVNVAGLGHAAIGDSTPHLKRMAEQGTLAPVQPTVPALTSTSQATLLTGTRPSEHGIVANGWYFRELAAILNWQRSANLVTGAPLWAPLAAADVRCANLFWRNSTHASGAAMITERPTYWVDGRKSPDVYAQPAPWRDELFAAHGPFPLFKFWGPLAGIDSTRWITDATISTMESGNFELILTYLPHLDYDHQRSGPDGPQGLLALSALDEQFGRLAATAQTQGMEVAVVSDYAFEPVDTPVFLNRALRGAGLLAVQKAENGELLEAGASRAFAVCDQQVAHVYVADPTDIPQTQKLLAAIPGVERVFGQAEIRDLGLDHSRSGELFVMASAKHWFAYHYWLEESCAPDFANCVAIHDKPGFDPTELFVRPGIGGKLHLAKRLAQKTIGLRIPFDVINTDTSVVRGSHGRIPTDNTTRPVLLTSWKRNDELIAMEDIRDQLLSAFAK